MKQIMLGEMQYEQDNDEVHSYVYSLGGEGSDPTQQSWAQHIMPYIKSTAIFKCPDDTYSRGTSATYLDQPPTPMSYSESLMWRDRSATHCASDATDSSIASPSSTIFLSERWNGYHQIEQGRAQDNWCDDGEFLGNNPAGATGHTGRSNYAFCDGHAKAVHFSQTVQLIGNEPPYTSDSIAVSNGDQCYTDTDTDTDTDTNMKVKAPHFGMWDTQQ